MAYSFRHVMIRERLVRALMRLLPDRAKRMVFIVSLAQLIRGKQTLPDQTLANINEIMELGFSKESMRFPSFIYNAIWRGLKPEQVCSEAVLCQYRELDAREITESIKKVKDHTEQWQTYGTSEQMQRDIEQLVRHRELLLKTA